MNKNADKMDARGKLPVMALFHRVHFAFCDPPFR